MFTESYQTVGQFVPTNTVIVYLSIFVASAPSCQCIQHPLTYTFYTSMSTTYLT